MTAPVDEDDIVQGCVKWLLDIAEIRDVLGVYTETNTPWLFQHELWTKVENTSSTAAVISYAGGWAGANQHNTVRFPRLSLDVYCDPIRDAAGNVTDPGEAFRRMFYVWGVFDDVLHRPESGTVMWGTVRTIGCTRITEPAVDYLPEGDGVRRLHCFYSVTQG